MNYETSESESLRKIAECQVLMTRELMRQNRLLIAILELMPTKGKSNDKIINQTIQDVLNIDFPKELR